MRKNVLEHHHCNQRNQCNHCNQFCQCRFAHGYECYQRHQRNQSLQDRLVSSGSSHWKMEEQEAKIDDTDYGDYADYSDDTFERWYFEGWRSSDGRRGEPGWHLPSYAARYGWYGNSCPMQRPPLAHSYPRMGAC